MYSLRALGKTSKGVLFKSFTAVFGQILDGMYRNRQVPGPDCAATWPWSVMPSNATRDTDHLDNLLLQLHNMNSPTLAIQGARKGCSVLIISNQVNQNLVVVNRTYFSEATIGFIYLSIVCIFIGIKVIYLNNVMFWFGCN